MVETATLIPEIFLKEEERSGHLVPQKKKEIWAIEIDLVAQLDHICNKYNLKYCVGAGTLLGTVRHKGFIPWDDDVDVYMLREDFDQLMEHSDEFQKPYFLQNSYNEPNLMRSFARLRNTETLGATTREIDLPIEKGIFIDIFPIDGISPSRFKDMVQKVKNRFWKDVCGCYNYSKTTNKSKDIRFRLKTGIYKCIAALFARNKGKAFRKFEQNLKKYSKDGTELWGNRTLIFDCPKSRRPYKDYADLIGMPFEFLSVPVPRAYDSMLRQQYGNYMETPKDKGKNMHGELIVSTSYSYDEWIKRQKETDNE